MERLTFSARSEPDCKSFLTIRWPDEEYCPIDEFIKNHPSPTLQELRLCDIQYRGKEQKYNDHFAECVAFSERMELLPPSSSWLITNPTIRAAHYFAEQTADCLQNARFFAIKSKLILDYKEPSIWKYGYLSQFSTRCIYFGTSTTWYSNAFDQLLQTVYWAYELYTAAKDRDGNLYDDSWDVKKIMTHCTYEFVVGELKNRNILDIRKALTSCSGKIEEVRKWANYIKHKGGIEYKYLKPEPPIQIYVFPAGAIGSGKAAPEDRFALKNFKSPIEVDIDEKMAVIETAHIAIYECATKIIEAIDFVKYQFSFGG